MKIAQNQFDPRHSRATIFLIASVWLWMGVGGVAGAESKVSYHHDILPILKRSCTGCHHPGKLKGELDLTTYAGLSKGGKHGAAFKAGDSKSSELVEQISGAEPSMPKEGDALSRDEIALIERWIGEGAKDDSPAEADRIYTAEHRPEYGALPVISSRTLSPDGAVPAS